MQSSHKVQIFKIGGVLIGFPIISTFISLLLINRSLISDNGILFFNIFWSIVIIWYILQILIINKILKSSNLNWTDIGFDPFSKKALYLILGYIIFSVSLIVFIEFALKNGDIDPDKFDSLSSLTPKTTYSRIIFIVMGFVAGISEEIVYRGFAIKSFESLKINKWLAAIIATIPFIFQHGLKSIDQFWWFLSWGLLFGALFLIVKRLNLLIVIHWLVILSAMVAILQVLR